MLHNVVEQLCPITFLHEITEVRQSVNVSELKESAAGLRQESAPTRSA